MHPNLIFKVPETKQKSYIYPVKQPFIGISQLFQLLHNSQLPQHTNNHNYYINDFHPQISVPQLHGN